MVLGFLCVFVGWIFLFWCLFQYFTAYTVDIHYCCSFRCMNFLFLLTSIKINYVCFHWIKGSPMGDDYFKPRGAYDKQTFWEQIDNGAQFTPTKKFLIMVPIVLYVINFFL